MVKTQSSSMNSPLGEWIEYKVEGFKNIMGEEDLNVRDLFDDYFGYCYNCGTTIHIFSMPFKKGRTGRIIYCPYCGRRLQL